MAPPTNALAGTTAGAIFQLIRDGRAATRADVLRLTGLSRSTVTQRLDALLALGLVEERAIGVSTGGRPPTHTVFNAGAGVVLAADFGATHARLAVTDLAGVPLAERADDHDIAAGPDDTVAWLVEVSGELLRAAGTSRADVRGIGIGVPGPVEFAAGRAVRPPIMPGWDGVSIPELLQPSFPVPVLVDNDVNIMALGEYWTYWRHTLEDLLFLKIGTGIGCGIVSRGEIQRGAQGAAGDIGHVRLSGEHTEICHCGNVGCVEAVASGDALAGKLRALGVDAANTRDVVRLVQTADPRAARLVREAGRHIGEVLATAVNILNPAVIVLGGDLAEAHDHLVAGAREVVYQRSTALATQHLRISHSQLGDRAGVTGAAVLILDHVLSADAVDDAVAAGALRGSA